jgi:hypothetical protein
MCADLIGHDDSMDGERKASMTRTPGFVKRW